MKAEIESVAIAAGSKLVPAVSGGLGSVAKLITEATSGQGQGGNIVRQLEYSFGGVASAAQTAVGPIRAVGGAIGALSFGALQSRTAMTGLTGALAGLAVLKVGQIVAASTAFQGVATSLSLVATAAKTGELAALPGLFAAAANPAVLLGAAAAAAGAGLLILATRESEAARGAREAADAKRDLANAIKDLHTAEQGEVDGKLSAQQATIDLKRAEGTLHQLRKDPHADALAIQQAELDVAKARNASGVAHRKYAADRKKTDEKIAADFLKSNERLGQAQDRLKEIQRQVDSYDGKAPPSMLKDLTAAQREYNRAMDEFSASQKVAGLSTLNLQRLQAGTEPILRKNAAGIQALTVQMNSLPKGIKPRINLTTDDQGALSKLGALSAQIQNKFKGAGGQVRVQMVLAGAETAKSGVLAFKALLAGVPKEKVAKVLAETDGEAEVRGLQGLIAGVHGKTVTVAVQTAGKNINDFFKNQPKLQTHAHGTKNAPGGMSLVGEQGPELVMLPKGSSVYTARDTRDRLKNWTGPAFAGGTKKIKDENPITGKVESHTAAQWRAIRLKAKHSKNSKARKQKKFEAPFTRFDRKLSGFNLAVTEAEATADKGDDATALSNRIGARNTRIAALRTQLAKKSLKGANRQKVQDELSNLIGANTSDSQAIADLTAATEESTAAQDTANQLLQQHNDLLKQQTDQANKRANTAEAVIQAFTKFVTGEASGDIASRVGLAGSTPAPNSHASY